MKLSIYPKVNFLPKNKDDKILQSKLTSSPNFPEVVEISTDEDLINTVTSFGWSPCIFSGYRNNNNFVSCDFMSLDVDSGLTIEEAESRVQKLGLASLCLPSPSFTPEFHKFRLIFPLAKTILNTEDFDATWDWLQQQFPELDAQCSDYARWYAPSKMEAGFWQDGEFLVPKKAPQAITSSLSHAEAQVMVPEELSEIVKLLYGKERETIPESVEFFLTNAHTGLPGLWINALNSCIFSLALSGVDDIIIEEVIDKISPEPLDKRDIYQINRAIRDGKKAREKI
jgi:hypothetical protein